MRMFFWLEVNWCNHSNWKCEGATEPESLVKKATFALLKERLWVKTAWRRMLTRGATRSSACSFTHHPLSIDCLRIARSLISPLQSTVPHCSRIVLRSLVCLIGCSWRTRCTLFFYIRTRVFELKLSVLEFFAIWASFALIYVLN